MSLLSFNNDKTHYSADCVARIDVGEIDVTRRRISQPPTANSSGADWLIGEVYLANITLNLVMTNGEEEEVQDTMSFQLSPEGEPLSDSSLLRSARKKPKKYGDLAASFEKFRSLSAKLEKRDRLVANGATTTDEDGDIVYSTADDNVLIKKDIDSRINKARDAVTEAISKSKKHIGNLEQAVAEEKIAAEDAAVITKAVGDRIRAKWNAAKGIRYNAPATA